MTERMETVEGCPYCGAPTDRERYSTHPKLRRHLCGSQVMRQTPWMLNPLHPSEDVEDFGDLRSDMCCHAERLRRERDECREGQRHLRHAIKTANEERDAARSLARDAQQAAQRADESWQQAMPVVEAVAYAHDQEYSLPVRVQDAYAEYRAAQKEDA